MSDIVDKAEKEIRIFERIGKATSESLISEIRQQAEDIQRLREDGKELAYYCDAVSTILIESGYPGKAEALMSRAFKLMPPKDTGA